MVPRHVDGRHRFGTGGGLRNYPSGFMQFTTQRYNICTCTYMCNPRGIRLFREQSGGRTPHFWILNLHACIVLSPKQR